MSNEVGRPSELNDELCLKIRQYVLEGKTMKAIAIITEIPEETYEGWLWRNYKGFSDRYRTYKLERRLEKSEQNIDKILDLSTDDKDIVKVIADMSKFVAETVGKKDYAKRQEFGGIDGKDLIPTPIIDLNKDNALSEDNSNQEDNQPN